MSVGLIGSGPAIEAVEAALGDVDAEVARLEPRESGDVDLAVVADTVGSRAFARANRAASTPWIAVELGGVGGHAIEGVDASVSGLDPAGGCYDCLRQRVAATLDATGTEAEPRSTRADARLAGAVAGRRAASAHERGELDAGWVVEVPHAEREFLPVPGCSCVGGPERGLDRAHAEVGLDESIDRAERAIDDRVGIVSAIGEVHSFPAPYYLADLCDTTAFSDAEAGPKAAGVAADWDTAFMKAAGEALERYAAGVYRESWFETAPAADLDDAVPPASFVVPGEGYATPDPEESIPWVEGEDLHAGERVRLPAEFAVFPPPERRHAPSITTGLGLGASTVNALLSGLYEVIERDATMLSWYSTFEPLGLSVADPGFAELAKRARSEGLSVTPVLVTQDVDVPVVSVTVHREGEWPEFAAGSAADLDPAAAARSALAEAVQNWMELRSMGSERAAEEATAIARYADFPPEAASLVDPGASLAAADVGPAQVPTGVDELDAVLDRVADAGLSAYAARLTPPDVAAIGFEAVRALVPSAQPLFTDERFFGERARTVPRELGFRPRLDRPPHPYP